MRQAGFQPPGAEQRSEGAPGKVQGRGGVCTGGFLSQPIYAKLAAGTIKNAYNLALGDWFHPPVIHSIEKRDGKIFIQASDDVCVASLRVMIVDEAGSVLEQGDAVQLEGDLWEYQPATEEGDGRGA